MFARIICFGIVTSAFCLSGCGGAAGGLLSNDGFSDSDADLIVGSGETLKIIDASHHYEDQLLDIVLLIIENELVVYELDYLGDSFDNSDDCYLRLDFSVEFVSDVLIASSVSSQNNYAIDFNADDTEVYSIDRHTEENNGLMELFHTPAFRISDIDIC